MPIYEYKCVECGEQFSLIQTVGASESETICTKCGSHKVEKLVSTFSCCNPTSSGSSGGPSFSGGG